VATFVGLTLNKPGTGYKIHATAIGLTASTTGPFNVVVPIPHVPADFDRDGKTDLTVYRPTSGRWIISQSTAGLRVVGFGSPGVAFPLLGDYDGDGKADLAVYRPTTGQWLIQQSSNNQLRVQAFGLRNVDFPVPADFDGDGKADLAVYRPTTGQW